MKKLCVALLLLTAALIPALPQRGNNPFLGRWDLTVTSSGSTYPGWMEMTEKDGDLQARVQPREGGVLPAPVKRDGSHVVVTVEAAVPARPATDTRPAAPARPSLTWELDAKGGKLIGVQKLGDTVQGQVTAVQAPLLKRAAPTAWTDPEPLFNGKDLTGWVTVNNTQSTGAREVNHWVVKDGELVTEATGHNILTTRKFDDFKLHLEFNLSERANSGIYLRGRYECQLPPPGAPRPGAPARRGGAGGGPGEGGGLGYAIHGFVSAIARAPGGPGEWRTCDITLVGRNVTMAVNGVTIVDNQEIPGTTGGALDSNEGEPGPILLQGDHAPVVKFRNITISVPKR